MIDLAEHNGGGYITLRDIAGRQEISEKYLESIISVLVKAHFVEGMRGKGGGYRLTRSPERYTVGSVLKLTEGSVAPVACLGEKSKNCRHATECKTLPMWEKLDALIDEYLEGVTVADLAGREGGPGGHTGAEDGDEVL